MPGDYFQKLLIGCVTPCRVVQQHMQNAPKLLALFLGDSGIGHPDEVSLICKFQLMHTSHLFTVA